MTKFKDGISGLAFLAYGAASFACVTPAFAADSEGGSGEIVVTAQKRTQLLQDVPAAVSIVGSENLDRLRITQLTDLTGHVPGLQLVSAGSPGQSGIAIRGVSPLGAAGGSPVATYIDETPIGGSNGYAGANNFALDLLPYDLVRVEVLRGPQGTLYGANALGGLLKYVLTTPKLNDTEIRGGADLFGMSGTGKLGGSIRAAFNGALLPGKLGLIASYGYQKTPGYIDNFQTDENNVNGARQESARLALLWKLSDAVSVRLNGLYQRVNSDGNASVALDTSLKPIDGAYGDNVYTDQPFKKKIYYTSATVDADLGWAALTSASSYSKTSSRQILDQSRQYGPLFPFFGVPPGITDYIWTLRQKKLTQEVRLASPASSKLEWLVGAFYAFEDTYNRQVNTATSFAGVPILAVDPIGYQLLPTKYYEYAAFANAGYEILPNLKIQGGVRFAHNHQKFKNVSTGIFYGDSNTQSTSSESVWTYRIGPQFKLSKDVMLYGSVSTGYQAGGPNFAPASVAGPYKSSTVTNYELGVKAQTPDRRATLNVAVFNIDWKDILVLGITNLGQYYYSNGGAARSRGIEAEAAVVPLEGLSLSANMTYTNAILKSDVPSVGGLSGDRLPYTPKLGIAGQVDYEFELAPTVTSHLGAAFRYQGTRYSAVNHASNSFPVRKYTIFDLNGEVTFSNYTVRLFVKNLTDKKAYNSYTVQTNALTGVNDQIEATLVQPRTIGLAIDFKL